MKTRRQPVCLQSRESGQMDGDGQVNERCQCKTHKSWLNLRLPLNPPPETFAQGQTRLISRWRESLVWNHLPIYHFSLSSPVESPVVCFGRL